MSFKFRFSVIIPVYNLEEYIEESIECIVKQTVGFSDNIQMILVNDGSQDESGKICSRYADMYPENVIYISQENAGVSAARNKGLEHADGKYILFFDGDDVLPKNAFEIAGKFFDEHYDEIDLLACRQAFFEAKRGFHNVDYKFKNGDRIIDINKEPDFVHMNITSSFLKAEAVNGKSFDTRLSVGEDSRFAMEVILEKQKYGVLKSVVYKVRKRANQSSVTQNYDGNKSRNVETMEHYYEYIAELSKEKYGKIIPFVQYSIIHGIKSRITGTVPDMLNEDEKKVYIDRIINLVKQIDDKILLTVRNATLNQRLYFLALKDKEIYRKAISIDDGKVYYQGELLEEINGQGIFNADEIKLSDTYVALAGRFNLPTYGENFSAFADVNGRRFAIKMKVSDAKTSFVGDTINLVADFQCKFELNKGVSEVYFGGEIDGKEIKFPLGSITDGKVFCESGKTAMFFRNGKLTVIAGEIAGTGSSKLSTEGDCFFRYKKLEGKTVSPYIQHTVLKGYSDILSKTDGDISRLSGVLCLVDDKNMLTDKGVKWWHRINAFDTKNKTNITKKLTAKAKGIYYGETRLTGYRNTNLVRINLLDIEGGRLMLEGMTRLEILRGCTLYLKVNNKRLIKAEIYERPHLDRRPFAEKELFYGKNFRVNAKLKGVETLKLVLVKNKTSEEFNLMPSFGTYAKLSRRIKGSYYSKGKYILTVNGADIIVSEKTGSLLIEHETAMLKELLKDRKFGLIAYRIGAVIKKKIMKKLLKKEIWIICDRTDKALDNGEALFEYICDTVQPKDKKVYFTIDGDSKDYSRIAAMGPVLKTGSLRLKLNWLCADKLISSQQSSFFLNMFGEESVYMKDLYKYKFAYIQHGINAGDFSAIFNKQRNNVSLFISAAEGEFNSLIDGKYGYQKSDVKLTGLARFDWLQNNAGKQLVICPTWRQNLAAPLKPGSSERMYSETFKSSEFFKFYNGLINSPKLLAAMKEKGYTGIVSLHPAQKAQIKDFAKNSLFTINDGSFTNNQLFAESALMITDYSSASFDFAYLKKPVIYTQFDYDEFFSTHTANQGFFEYDRDGFGPVCHSLDETIDAIIGFMDHECKLEGEYLERVEKFYRYFDSDNCKRVYEAIE